MKFLKEHNTTAEYIDDFMRGDWYNTPECYATPSISYISEDLSLHCFNPREKRMCQLTNFGIKVKETMLLFHIIPTVLQEIIILFCKLFRINMILELDLM